MPASAESLIAEVPAFAPYARSASLLRPAAGTPGVQDGSVGGPLLWPRDEPWPLCRTPHMMVVREKLTDEERETWQRIDRDMKERHRRNPHRAYEITEEEARAMDRIMAGAGALDTVAWERARGVRDTSGPAVPMVPVLQLYARDAPGDHWPAGMDVLQVLWCPNDHSEPPGQPGYYGPTVEVRHRSSSAVTTTLNPPKPDRADDCYLPRPCTLDPLRITDLPAVDELPANLYDEGCRWAEKHGVEYDRGLACRGGWKIGGWPSWHLTDLIPIDCSCGTRMRLFLTMESSNDGPDINVGRFGELRIFTCPADPAHPIRLNIQ
ncbi:hypothetical protein [Actinoallomurus iriomotensis]|uniref:DUF1963 domain-containing protein n=1 Tax=Actinoallomurus iriomotensis TaxID=478107 RepID=A0A9W6SBS4_9ACTN|nr:hypothetical protein [Actinoallomurus iriomotensis]GLY92021.1 hypothetical protein Airi02_099490 [Actinoallomurus iriomotensis]